MTREKVQRNYNGAAKTFALINKKRCRQYTNRNSLSGNQNGARHCTESISDGGGPEREPWKD